MTDPTAGSHDGEPLEPVEPVEPVDEDATTAVDVPIVEPEPEAEPFPTLRERVTSWWGRTVDRFSDDPGKIVEAAVSVVAVVLATALVFAALRPTQFFNDNTPTGGDMGSHVWGPQYLLHHLLPHFRLSGWTPDWYDGFPAYQFYMVVPSLLVVIIYVGLPWYLAVPAVGLCIALGLLGWMKERLYRYRWAFVSMAGFLTVLVLPLSYNRSFKVVTALGLLGLPAACWLLAKLADLPFPAPPLFAGAALIFLFNRQPVSNNTGNIIGGNFQSTMAGEFAFSISLTFAVLYLGVAIRGLRTGKHRALAAVLFAMAGLCHLIPAFFVLACTGALFVLHPGKARLKWLMTTIPVAGLLTAFWVVPFYLRSDYVNDMGWERLPSPSADEAHVWYYLWPKALFWLFVAAVVGVVLSIIRKRVVGLVLAFAWAGVAAGFTFLPQARLWNARLLPFQYLAVSLLAALALAELIHLAATAAAGNVERPFRAVSVVAAVIGLFGILLYVVLPLDGILASPVHVLGITVNGPITREPYASGSTTGTRSSFLFFDTTAVNPAAGWSNYNYQGLEEKQAQPAGCDLPGSTTPCNTGGYKEYRALVRTMAGLGEDPRYGCGRAFWEYDNTRVAGYGTPMALMMLPYWTDGCIGSQEGLYFESSTTVPYHFLMQAELSAQGSVPQRDIVYPGFDIDAGVRHLQLLGVRYYLAQTTIAVNAASHHPDLKEVALSGPWHIYQVKQSATVTPLTVQPVVAKGMGESQQDWLPTASAWFLQPGDLDVPVADGGPKAWKRVQAKPVPTDWRRSVIYLRNQLGLSGAIDEVPELPRVKLPENKVSHIEMGRDTISFDVTTPGVPVLVKTSYFPNWQVSGADGPYRVTPNLMVVIPHGTHVSMHYSRTPVDILGIVLTIVGLAGLVFLLRRPPVEVPPTRPSRVSAWLDEMITIPPLEKGPPRFGGRGDDRFAHWEDDDEPVASDALGASEPLASDALAEPVALDVSDAPEPTAGELSADEASIDAPEGTEPAPHDDLWARDPEPPSGEGS